MRGSSEYAGLAEKALEDAKTPMIDERKQEQLWVEAQVWASLAIAASTVDRG